MHLASRLRFHLIARVRPPHFPHIRVSTQVQIPCLRDDSTTSPHSWYPSPRPRTIHQMQVTLAEKAAEYVTEFGKSPLPHIARYRALVNVYADQ